MAYEPEDLAARGVDPDPDFASVHLSNREVRVYNLPVTSARAVLSENPDRHPSTRTPFSYGQPPEVTTERRHFAEIFLTDPVDAL